jgi:mono/diheme cytochrome c family protein
MTARTIKPAMLLSVCWVIALGGCKASPPGKWETAAMTRAKRTIFVGGKKDKNPLPPSQENIALGRESFSHYCAACHGLDGQNTGVPFANRMSPPVPSLASAGVQAYADGQLKWVIDNGLWPSGMPGNKGILTDEEIWSTVVYVRHLPPAGSLGEPAMYNGDECAGDSDTESPTAAPKKR